MKLITVSLLMAIPALATAQNVRLVDGDYEGKADGGAMSLRTIVADSDKGVVVARASVGAAGCAGDFVGIGQVKGNVLRLSPFVKEEGVACVVSATFDRTGKKVTVTEDGCSYYHGAACSFDGSGTKRR